MRGTAWKTWAWGALAAVALFSLGFFLGQGLGDDPSPASAESEKLTEIRAIIEENYFYEIDATLAAQGLCRGLVEALGDVYSEYFTPEEMARYVDESNASVVGVGAEVEQNIYTGLIEVTSVEKGGPAEVAGLLPLDWIVAVDGVSTESRPLTAVVEDVIGPEGSLVELTVYRPSTEETLAFSLQRKRVVSEVVEAHMLDEHTGYLQITEFVPALPEQFRAGIERLEAQGMTQLVIDLRYNLGGDFDAVVAVADYLLPDELPGLGGKTAIVATQYKDGSRESHHCNDDHALELPLAILTNGESASASELLCGALRDNGRALLVGEKTFGKGTMQRIYELSDGGGLKLTMAAYETPNGFLLHGLGLEPDIPVTAENGDESGQDVQLQAAVTALEELSAGQRALPPVTAIDS